MDGLSEYFVDYDRFEPINDRGLCFPCYACKHRDKDALDLPCRICAHNVEYDAEEAAEAE